MPGAINMLHVAVPVNGNCKDPRTVKAGTNEKTLLWKHSESMLLTVAWVSKRQGGKTFFASETQILRLQNLLHGYASEETIWKHSKSVFPRCFVVCAPTQNMLNTQNVRLESRKCF